jgi:hypothetical protein
MLQQSHQWYLWLWPIVGSLLLNGRFLARGNRQDASLDSDVKEAP